MRFQLPEIVVPGKRLGRHINHDPRSLNYLVGETSNPTTVRWSRVTPVLDQGNLGSCVGNAMVGLLGTEPLFVTMPAGIVLDEAFAVKIYSLATQLDSYAGQYPPDDTGSDGLSGAKAVQQDTLASGYVHAVTLAGLHNMIKTGPFAVGVSWYSGMDNPDRNGLVSASGTVRGGHEFAVIGYDSNTNVWECVNSWSDTWGVGGHFFITDADMAKLLSEQGDATQLVPLTSPAPQPATPGLPPDVVAWAQRTATSRGWCVSKRDKAAALELLSWHGTA